MQCHGVQILLKPPQYIPGEFRMHFVTNRRQSHISRCHHEITISALISRSPTTEF